MKSPIFDMRFACNAADDHPKVQQQKKHERNLIELNMKLTHFEGLYSTFLTSVFGSTAPVSIDRNHFNNTDEFMTCSQIAWRDVKRFSFSGKCFRSSHEGSNSKYIHNRRKTIADIYAHLNGAYSLCKWPMFYFCYLNFNVVFAICIFLMDEWKNIVWNCFRYNLVKFFK